MFDYGYDANIDRQRRKLRCGRIVAAPGRANKLFFLCVAMSCISQIQVEKQNKRETSKVIDWSSFLLSV